MPKITIDLPAEAIPRVKAALRGRFPKGPNPATGEEYPEPTDAENLTLLATLIRDFVKREVRDFERHKAAADAAAATTDIDVN